MNFIITSDWHICDKIPLCRIDLFEDNMFRKVTEIVDLADEYDAKILIAGDLFDKWRISHKTMTHLMMLLERSAEIFCIPGQHDLPQHNLRNLYTSALGELTTAGYVLCANEVTMQTYEDVDIVAVPFGEKVPKLKREKNRILILMLHQFTYQKTAQDWQKDIGTKDTALLKKYPEADMIITGDNHQRFMIDQRSQILINPGSMMRRTADQYDHEPAVYLYDSERHEVEEILLDICPNHTAISREHIDRIELHETRISTFVRRLSDDYEVGLSFESNIEAFLSANKVQKPVEELIHEAMECQDA